MLSICEHIGCDRGIIRIQLEKEGISKQIN